MSYAHLIFGIIVFVTFLVTGRLMRADFPDKSLIEPEFRMLMRSRHIYILLAALVHIALGVYLELRPHVFQKALQIFGSFLFSRERACSFMPFSTKPTRRTALLNSAGKVYILALPGRSFISSAVSN